METEDVPRFDQSITHLPPLETGDTSMETSEDTEDSIEATDPTFYDMCNKERNRNYAKVGNGNVRPEESDEIFAFVQSISSKVSSTPNERRQERSFSESFETAERVLSNGERLLSNGEIITVDGPSLNIYQTGALVMQEQDFDENVTPMSGSDSSSPTSPRTEVPTPLDSNPVSDQTGSNSSPPPLEFGSPERVSRAKPKTQSEPKQTKKPKKRKRTSEAPEPPRKKRKKRKKKSVEVITVDSDSSIHELSRENSPAASNRTPSPPPSPSESTLLNSEAPVAPLKKEVREKSPTPLFRSTQKVVSIQPKQRKAEAKLARLVLPHPLPGLIVNRKIKVHWDTVPPPTTPWKVLLTIDNESNKFDFCKLIIPFAAQKALSVRPDSSRWTTLGECTITGYVEIQNEEDFKQFQAQHGRLRFESPGFLWFISRIKEYDQSDLIIPYPKQSKFIRFDVGQSSPG